MEKTRVLFGTPEPIWYREWDERLGYDLDISCKVSGTATIFEYPEELSEEALNQTVKETAVSALEECLHNKPSGRPLYSSNIRQQAVLGKAIEDALLLKGIRAEAEIVNFTLEDQTKEELDALIKEYIIAATPKMYVDEMYKPNPFDEYYRQNYKDLDGWMNKGQSQNFMEMMGDVMGMNSLNEGETWTCPNCKNSGNKGNFCPECGAKRPPFGSLFQGL